MSRDRLKYGKALSTNAACILCAAISISPCRCESGSFSLADVQGCFASALSNTATLTVFALHFQMCFTTLKTQFGKV